MTRVDFYQLPDEGTRERFTCDIASKIYGQKLKLYIHTSSREEASALDDLLWTFKDISFLPHSLIDDDDVGNSITIGWECQAAQSNEVMINLSAGVPECVADFDRIVEIVPADSSFKQQARDRYKHYRQAGFELHNHDLKASNVLA